MPKKPKLTPEEKKALRIKKRAEKKRLAAEKKIQQKFDHLGREIQYGNLTIQRHEKNWKQMLLNIALPHMRVDLEYAWHNFERVIDSKDFTISLLMDEISDAEEQYMMNMRSHMANIDNLIILCYDQIAGLRNESKEVIQQLYTAANVERSDIIAIAKENEEYLKTMLYMLENAKKESEKLIRGEYLSKQEVEIGKLNDINSKFTDELEVKYSNLWKEGQKFLKDYIAKTANRKKQYNQLKDLDEMNQKHIRALWNRIRKNLETIKILKSKFTELQIAQSRKVNELSNERKHFENVFQLVKLTLETELIMDERNLITLTLESNSTIRYLEEIEKKGEDLLKLSAICRKYETPEEKTMAFPVLHDPEQFSGNDISLDGCAEALCLFWNRIGQADALRFNLNEECEYLTWKNNNLKKQIHEYCECLNCPVYEKL